MLIKALDTVVGLVLATTNLLFEAIFISKQYGNFFAPISWISVVLRQPQLSLTQQARVQSPNTPNYFFSFSFECKNQDFSYNRAFCAVYTANIYILEQNICHVLQKINDKVPQKIHEKEMNCENIILTNISNILKKDSVV